MPRERAQVRGRWIELGVALAVPLFLFVLYLRSPTDALWDAKYAVLTSEAILEGEGVDLSRFLPELSADRASAQVPAAELPWQLERSHGRLLYLFPPGTPVLSLPLVASLRLLGYSALDANGLWRERQESRMQLFVASFLSALTALLVLRLARHEVSLLPAAAIALLAGVGSSLWTIAAHELWSHTWCALLLGAGWLELLRWEEGKTPRPVLLGAIAGAAFWVRPSTAWIALVWTIFVALRHRRQTLRLAISGACGLGAYCAWSLHYSGVFLPTYLRMSRPWRVRSFPQEVLASLFSTHHGLLVYSPILLAALYVLFRHGIPESRRPLATLGTLMVLGHFGLHAASGAVWGPDGPRLQHDLVPLLAWFGALAVRRLGEIRARGEGVRGRLRPAAISLTIALAAASVLASIGSVYVGRHAMGRYRARLEASYPQWDLRRLPQYLGLRVLAGEEGAPPPARRKKGTHPSPRQRREQVPDPA